VCREKTVYLNTKADQYSQGFKLLPVLTEQWRVHRKNWERKLEGLPSLHNDIVPLPPSMDEEAIEQGYWEFHELHNKSRNDLGPMSERDAFKHIVRKLIREHLK
jgi:hypothetical protein